MKDEKYIAKLGELYENYLDTQKDEDYEINPPQMDKFAQVVEFFLYLALENGASIDYDRLSPKERHGGITASFTVFDLYGADLARFCEIMKYTSALSIDASADGDSVNISVTVPDIFIRKDEVDLRSLPGFSD